MPVARVSVNSREMYQAPWRRDQPRDDGEGAVMVIGVVLMIWLCPAALFSPFVAVAFLYQWVIHLPSTFLLISIADPIIYGALAGMALGWLRRGFRVRSRFAESLLTSLITSKFWEEAGWYSFLEILLNGFAGASVGYMFTSGGVFASSDMLSSTPFAFGIVFGGNGGGSGGGDLDAWSFLPLVVAAMLLTAVVLSIVSGSIASHLLAKAMKGAAEETTVQVTSTFLEKWGVKREDRTFDPPMSDVTRKGFRDGMWTGLIVGVVLLLFRHQMMN